jgi:hypothetical protein
VMIPNLSSESITLPNGAKSGAYSSARFIAFNTASHSPEIWDQARKPATARGAEGAYPLTQLKVTNSDGFAKQP